MAPCRDATAGSVPLNDSVRAPLTDSLGRMLRSAACRRSRRHVLLLVATISPAAGSASSASASWSTAADLSPVGQTASAPVVAIGAGGHAAMAWRANTVGLEVSTREPGGSWSATPVVLSTPGSEVQSYQAVVDAEGDVTVLWGEYTMNEGDDPWDLFQMGPVEIYAATRPAGGAWGTPARLSTPGESSNITVLAIGTDGAVAALWTEGADIMVATRPRAGSWTAAAAIPSSGGAGGRISAAFAPDGRLTVVWRTWEDSVKAASLPAGGAWSAVTTLTNLGVEPVLTVDGRGVATASWIYWNTISSAETGAGDDTWSAPVQISVDGGRAEHRR